MTPFQLHVKTWSDCTACKLHETRKKVVLAKGDIPADVLFIGEAPGKNENLTGTPFIGPAGNLLTRMIGHAKEQSGTSLRMAFTNIVACIPVDENGKKVHEPEKECVKACEPRLVEFVRLVKPKAIVLVGKEANKYICGQANFTIEGEDNQPPWLKGKFMIFEKIMHPAAILRINEATQGLHIERCVTQLVSVFLEVKSGGPAF